MTARTEPLRSEPNRREPNRLEPNRLGTGSIVTPEAVVLDFELAGVGSRSIAYAVDFLLQLIALFLLLLVAGVSSVGSDVGAIIVLLVGLIVIIFGYPVAMETMNNGRTVGRLIVGTRVVTVEGAPVRFRHALIRALLGIIDLLASSGAVAVVAALVTRRGQRLGDLVAGTMVIRERKDVGKTWAQPIFAAPHLALWARDMDPSPLGDDGYQIVRDYLRRYPELSEAEAGVLGLEVEELVTERMPLWRRPGSASITDWLRTIAAKAQAPDSWGGGAMPPPPRASSKHPPPPMTNQQPPPPPPGPPGRVQPPPPMAPSAQPPVPSRSALRPPPPGVIAHPQPSTAQPPPPAGGGRADSVPPPPGVMPAPVQAPAGPKVDRAPAPNDGGFTTPG